MTNFLPQLKQGLIERFPSYKESHQEFITNCPECIKRVGKEDRKKKLYINIYKNKFNCFRCQYRGQATDLVTGFEYEFNPSAVQDESLQLDPTEPELLPDNIVHIDELDEQHPGIQYLLSRVPDFREMELDLYYADNYIRNNYDFGPRIFFPIFSENKYLGFQARSIDPNHKIRYVNGVNLKKSRGFYNWDKIKLGNRIIITEGVFDQLACGPNAVFVAGKFVSEYQKNLILESNFKELYVFLDSSEISTSKRIATMFSKYGLASYYIFYRGKDPGSLSRQEIDYLLNNKTVYPDFGSIRVF